MTFQVQRFSHFLPPDNEENPESEQIVSSIAEGLLVLLKLRATAFWEEARHNESLIACLGSYLQFSRYLSGQSINNQYLMPHQSLSLI